MSLFKDKLFIVLIFDLYKKTINSKLGYKKFTTVSKMIKTFKLNFSKHQTIFIFVI